MFIASMRQIFMGGSPLSDDGPCAYSCALAPGLIMARVRENMRQFFRMYWEGEEDFPAEDGPGFSFHLRDVFGFFAYFIFDERLDVLGGALDLRARILGTAIPMVMDYIVFKAFGLAGAVDCSAGVPEYVEGHMIETESVVFGGEVWNKLYGVVCDASTKRSVAKSTTAPNFL